MEFSSQDLRVEWPTIVLQVACAAIAEVKSLVSYQPHFKAEPEADLTWMDQLRQQACVHFCLLLVKIAYRLYFGADVTMCPRSLFGYLFYCTEIAARPQSQAVSEKPSREDQESPTNLLQQHSCSPLASP